IATNFVSTRATTPTLSVNGRAVALPAASGAGSWSAVARVYLPQGINELTVGASTSGTLISDVTTLRAAAQKAADADAA
ncbi:hypothetical protein SB767_36120, partial [Bacillus sp. SIMBA_069]